jgi:type IV secretory pathway TraG/TraD family ATPase VirD4
MKYIIQVNNQSQPSPLQNLSFFATPSGLMLLGSAAILALLAFPGKGKSGKLATSFWGGGGEKARAAKKALAQVESPKRNNASFFIGRPPVVAEKLAEQWLKEQLQTKPPRYTNRPLFIPDIQRGIAVCGGAGSGKTFSVIDPAIQSSLDQGFPLVLYDFKYPAQTSRAVAYALKRGYKVRVFAPGFPESDTCNILDFLRDEEDAIAAGQLAQVITKNADLSNGSASSDKFFEDAGATLTEGIFLLTKAIAGMKGKQYADLMTASAILGLSELGKRLASAQAERRFPIWTMRPLAQIISVSGSPETESSIIGTAQRTFQKFLKKDFIRAFCGQSTLPLDLDGKEMLVFGLDRNNRDIVGPLLAAVLHSVVSGNVSRLEPRKEPLTVFIDELPTLFLPQLQNWFNENREDGFCGCIGFQNMSQLERIYGKELSKVIVGGCATKFIFNPQDTESAKYFADFLGEFEVQFKSKSLSRNSSAGKGGGSSSRSTSDNRQKRYLFEPSQFLKLRTGQAVVINPAYVRGEEAYIPIRQKIKVPKFQIQELEWSQEKWATVRQYLASRRNNQATNAEIDAALDERTRLVEELFPLPPKSEAVSPSSIEDVYASAVDSLNV